jgi:hypothetical protein
VIQAHNIGMTTLDGPAGYLTVQFLTWVAEAPRSYGDAMDAWRSSCPRLTIWDDAVREGLVRTENGRGPMRKARVLLTERGRTLLASQAARIPAPREVAR